MSILAFRQCYFLNVHVDQTNICSHCIIHWLCSVFQYYYKHILRCFCFAPFSCGLSSYFEFKTSDHLNCSILILCEFCLYKYILYMYLLVVSTEKKSFKYVRMIRLVYAENYPFG